jgi:cyclohexa-1,5-dienecarbonyl-CoA hydratase
MTQPLSVAFNGDRSRAAFTIFHPTGNIITADLVAALRSALAEIEEDRHLKLITIEGAGADFSFGASIPEHAAGEIGRVLPEMHGLIDDLLGTAAPTAALVRGRCLGGGFELALACDFIFAEQGASFALPEIALGVFPPAAAALLPLRAGYARATRAILTGEKTTVADWAGAGLVDVIAESGELQLAWRRLRHATAAARMGLVAHVRQHLPQLERLYLNDLMRTHDAVEGIDAFLEKRKPSWTDR